MRTIKHLDEGDISQAITNYLGKLGLEIVHAPPDDGLFIWYRDGAYGVTATVVPRVKPAPAPAESATPASVPAAPKKVPGFLGLGEVEESE